MARLNLLNLGYQTRTHEAAPGSSHLAGASASPVGAGLPALGVTV